MGKFGFSWSWKRALGISKIKRKISKKTGVPLTKSGRQKKVGRMFGCCISLLTFLIMILTVVASASILLK